MTSTTSQSGFGDPSYKRLDVDDIYNFAVGIDGQVGVGTLDVSVKRLQLRHGN